MTKSESAASEIYTAALANWVHSSIASVVYNQDVHKATCHINRLKGKSDKLEIPFLFFLSKGSSLLKLTDGVY